MKALKTKVILSAFVLLFALVATIGSTFAWFTVASTVTIPNMELSMKAEQNMLIRVANLDGSLPAGGDLTNLNQYKSVLTTDDILPVYPFDGNGTPANAWRLSPTTVINATYTGVEKTTLRILETGDNFTRDLETAEGSAGTAFNSSNGRFIELAFYLLYQGTESNPTQQVVLQDLVISSTSDGTAKEVVDAVRLAVWKAGSHNLILSSGSSYAANGAAESEAHIFGRTIDYGFAFLADRPLFYTGSTPSLVNGFNNLSQISLTTTSFNSKWHDATVNLAAETLPIAEALRGGVTTLGDATTVVTLSSNVPTHIKVRIFVEGWAAKTTDNIITSAFGISFKFTFKS